MSNSPNSSTDVVLDRHPADLRFLVSKIELSDDAYEAAFSRHQKLDHLLCFFASQHGYDARHLRYAISWLLSSSDAPSFTVPTSSRPAWLSDVLRRIDGSIDPNLRLDSGDTEHLRPDVASSARSFFEQVGDYLPREPAIFASKRGDLIAEFESNQLGLQTVIVSPTDVRLFAELEGGPEYTKIENWRAALPAIRDALSSIAEKAKS